MPFKSQTYLSRFNSDMYVQIVNSILLQIKPLIRRGKLTFIVDASRIDLDSHNIKRKHLSPDTVAEAGFTIAAIHPLVGFYHCDFKQPSRL